MDAIKQVNNETKESFITSRLKYINRRESSEKAFRITNK